MKKNRFLHFLPTVFMLVSVSACASAQPTAPQRAPLRVAFTQWWGDYTLLVAQEKGFFQKYGVQVEPVYYEIFSDSFPDMAAGQVDAGFIAVGDAININRMTPLKVVAVSDDGGDNPVVASPEIGSVQDLKGKTIGVLTGSQYELIVSEMLKSAGMDSGDASIVSIPPEEALAALENGQAQAVCMWEPYLSEAISSGYKVIYPEEQLRLFPDLIAFRKSVTDQRAGDVEAFLKAWFEAVTYRLQNPQETSFIAARYLGIDSEEVQPDDNLKIFTLEDNRIAFDLQNERSVYYTTKLTSDYLISIGTMTQLVDPLVLLDPAYLP